MNLSQVLNDAVNAYHITIGNISLWAPYLRNDNYTQDPSVRRGLGKSSAAEIKESAEYIVSLFPEADSDMIRRKLIDGSLADTKYNYKAIECSGFIFHVMDTVYQKALSKNLIEDLSVPKSHVLNGARNLDEWRSAYQLSDQEAESLPEDVPMVWVVEHFKRKPVNLCRIAGLVSDFSSVSVDAADMRVGDLIHMNIPGDPIPHAVIVTGLDSDNVTIAHSTRSNPSDVGGVSVEVLPRVNDHPDTSKMRVPHDYIAIRRLRSLNQL